MLPHICRRRETKRSRRSFRRQWRRSSLRFIPYFHGRTLALFTARSRMRMVHEQIAEPLREKGYPVLCQGDGALAKLQRRVRGARGGEPVRHALIVGRHRCSGSIALVCLHEQDAVSRRSAIPLEGARVAAVERGGGNGFYDYFLPKTIFTSSKASVG